MRITFVRHATFAFEMDGTTVMVCRAAPEARVVAVHMEAVNHCLLGRDDLEAALRREGLSERVKIPADGETFEVP